MPSTPRKLTLSSPLRSMAATDRQVLLVCLAAAFFFWLILNLSQEYEVTKEVRIDYAVDPERVVAGQPPTSLPVQLEARGWNLIWEGIMGNVIPVTVDLRDQEQFELTNIYLQQQIRRKLSSGAINITNLNYEARPILTTPLEGKRVPVVSRLAVTYQPGYRAAGPPRFSPDSVTVSGAADRLDTIADWPTVAATFRDVQADLSGSVELVAPETGIEVNYREVDFRLAVAAYIEQRIVVPVTVENAPQADSSRVFPQVITLHVTVPQRDYGRYGPEDFRLVADLRRLQATDGQNLVPLVLEESPSGINSVVFEPLAVEYYVYRRAE